MVAFLAFLMAIPAIEWIIAGILTLVVSGMGLFLFDYFQITVIRLGLLALGIYILIKIVLPNIVDIENKDKEKRLIVLALFGLLLILLGAPNIFFGAATGQTYTLSLN